MDATDAGLEVSNLQLVEGTFGTATQVSVTGMRGIKYQGLDIQQIHNIRESADKLLVNSLGDAVQQVDLAIGSDNCMITVRFRTDYQVTDDDRREVYAVGRLWYGLYLSKEQTVFADNWQ